LPALAVRRLTIEWIALLASTARNQKSFLAPRDQVMLVALGSTDTA
jgi:hypothetical protein